MAQAVPASRNSGMGRLAESVMARKKKVDFYSASPDVQPPSSIIPSLRYFRLCRIAQPPAVQVAAVCLPTLVTTNSPYSSSYPDSCFLGPVGTAQKKNQCQPLHRRKSQSSRAAARPPGKPTGIRNRDLRRVLVARPLPNLERNRDRDGADGANDDRPEVRGALPRRPLQVADGRGPEPGEDAGHREGCGLIVSSRAGVSAEAGWEGRFEHGIVS